MTFFQRDRMQIAAIVLLALIIRGPTFGFSSLGWDEDIFALVAREILIGNWPYQTVFDHKPVGLYLPYTAAYLVGGDNPVSGKVLAWVVVVAAAVTVRAIGTDVFKLRGPTATGFGIAYVLFATCVLYASSGFLVGLYLMLGFYCFMAPPAPGVARLTFAGALFGLAFQTNYLAGFPMLGFSVGYVVQRMRPFGPRDVLRGLLGSLRTAGAPLVGFVVANVAVLAPLHAAGSLEEYFFLQRNYVSGYGVTVGLRDLLAGFMSVHDVTLPIVALTLAYLGQRLSSAERDGEPEAWDSVLVTAGLYLGGVAATVVSRQFLDHYVQLVIPWVLLFAMSVLALPSITRRMRQWAIAVAIASSLTIVVPRTKPIAGIAWRTLTGPGPTGIFDRPRMVAARLAGWVGPPETIYVLCTLPVIYQLAGVRPPTRYPYYPHHTIPRNTRALGIDTRTEMRRIIAGNPKAIVLGDFESCVGVQREDYDWFRAHATSAGYRARERVADNVTILVVPEVAERSAVD